MRLLGARRPGEGGAWRGLADLPAAYEPALAASGARNLFLSRPWLENYIATVVDDPGRVRLIGASLPGGEAGVLPLYLPKPSRLLDFRRIESLANYYTALWEPLVTSPPEASGEVLGALARELLNSRWDVGNLFPMVAGSPMLAQLRRALHGQACLTHEYDRTVNWYVPVPEGMGFDGYLAARGAQVRTTTARRARKFDRERGARFEVVEGPGELPRAVAAFEAVYRARWGQNEPYPRFIPGLARICAERGWLRLGIAWVGDEPAAAQLWIVKDGVASIFKLAFDSRFNSLSVGSVATFKMFEHVLRRDRVREIDFLTGDDAYKRDWMTSCRRLVGLLVFNTRTVRGLAAAAAQWGGRAVKRLMRRSQEPPPPATTP